MSFKQIAIIAPTASGKTALSIELAHKYNAIILSLDSLSVYEEIDIVSAKPTQKERDGIEHFGIDVVKPNVTFDVVLFIEEYKKAKQYALQYNKNLIIVGGTSFYLKAMIDGLSVMPQIIPSVQKVVSNYMQDIEQTYNMLYMLDQKYMQNIKPFDKYRVQKALEVYLSTQLIPSIYFEQNKPQPIIKDIAMYEIQTDPDILRDRISKRTEIMLENGLIDEIIQLEKKYTREPNSMQSIGIKETLDYLDSKISKSQLKELISIHTAQLAKRQRTFNRSQFSGVIKGTLKELNSIIKF